MRCCIIITLFLAGPACAQEWVRLPDFPGVARDDAAAFSIDCHAFVGTGMQVGWSLTNDWYQFDMDLEVWDQVASLPSTPRQYCQGFVIESEGYLFGGLDANGPLNELWVYSPTTDTWAPRSPLPGPGRYACSVFTLGNSAFVATGMMADGIPTNELWEYNATSDLWTQRTALPGTGRHRTSAFRLAGFGFVCGGADASFGALSEVWKYDITDDSWSSATDLPDARYGASSNVIGSVGVVFCGEDATGTFRNDGYYYLTNGGGQWVPFGADFPTGRRGGVMLHSIPCAAVVASYYGTGSDATQRYNDWYIQGFHNGIEELVSDRFQIFPNPTTQTVTAILPTGWEHARLTIVDAVGRGVLMCSNNAKTPIELGELSPGRYEVIAWNGSSTLRCSVIKLP